MHVIIVPKKSVDDVANIVHDKGKKDIIIKKKKKKKKEKVKRSIQSSEPSRNA